MPNRSRQRPWKDRLPGGLADKYTPDDFDPDALARGIEVELEHTSDRDLATEIAMDHLVERPGGPGKLDYYEALATIDPHHNPRKRSKPRKKNPKKTMSISTLIRRALK